MAAYSLIEFDDLLTLTGNEFGDLLSGIFSPLAFLWLVLGFFQQGQELKASVDALELQGRELQHSVEQQRQLVEVTREQLAFQSKALDLEEAERDRSSRPKLELTSVSNSGGNTPAHRSHTFRISNFGHSATNVKIFDSETGEPLVRKALFDTGENISFRMEFSSRGSEVRHVRIIYVDGRGFNRTEGYEISISDGSLKVAPHLFD